jgi:class 3 adenylate cyclase
MPRKASSNLSSDSCIDYTVIGPNVNMVARLEEFTKNPKIGEILGELKVWAAAAAARWPRDPRRSDPLLSAGL